LNITKLVDPEGEAGEPETFTSPYSKDTLLATVCSVRTSNCYQFCRSKHETSAFRGSYWRSISEL